jgi:hypothetical protein
MDFATAVVIGYTLPVGMLFTMMIYKEIKDYIVSQFCNERRNI